MLIGDGFAMFRECRARECFLNVEDAEVNFGIACDLVRLFQFNAMLLTVVKAQACDSLELFAWPSTGKSLNPGHRKTVLMPPSCIRSLCCSFQSPRHINCEIGENRVCSSTFER